MSRTRLQWNSDPHNVLNNTQNHRKYPTVLFPSHNKTRKVDLSSLYNSQLIKLHEYISRLF